MVVVAGGMNTNLDPRPDIMVFLLGPRRWQARFSKFPHFAKMNSTLKVFTGAVSKIPVYK